MDWKIEPLARWCKDERHYEKKHPRELAGCLKNLKRYLSALMVSKNSKSVQAGYLHAEQAGVIAIDQRGGGGNLRETRLYTFADDEKKILYLITIGDKGSQHADVQMAKEFVKSLRHSSDE